jgi:hypothetical protein
LECATNSNKTGFIGVERVAKGLRRFCAVPLERRVRTRRIRRENKMIDSYFDGWIGIVILVISAFFFAYIGSFGYAISATCGIVAGMMIDRKIRGF